MKMNWYILKYRNEWNNKMNKESFHFCIIFKEAENVVAHPVQLPISTCITFLEIGNGNLRRCILNVILN